MPLVVEQHTLHTHSSWFQMTKYPKTLTKKKLKAYKSLRRFPCVCSHSISNVSSVVAPIMWFYMCLIICLSLPQ